MQSETHMEEVHELKKKYYGDFLSETVENKHLFEIINAIRNEYYIVLVTTASRKNSEDILNIIIVLMSLILLFRRKM